MPSAASLTSRGHGVEAGHDVPHEDQQRVAHERDERGGARQPGVGEQEREGGQRRDRVEHAGDRQQRARRAAASGSRPPRAAARSAARCPPRTTVRITCSRSELQIRSVLRPIQSHHSQRSTLLASIDGEGTRRPGYPAPVIRLEHVTKRYGDAGGGRRPHPRGRRRRAVRAGRPVRLRQDHHHADDQPPHRADRAVASSSTARTSSSSTRCSCAGASATSSSRSACSRTRRSPTTSPPSRGCSAGRRRR